MRCLVYLASLVCRLRGKSMHDHLTILDTCTCTSSLPLNRDHNVIHMAASVVSMRLCSHYLFLKRTSPNSKPTLIFFYLANLLYQLAKLSSSCCHVCVPKSPTTHHQGHVAKLSSPLHVLWTTPNELQTIHNYKNFWAVQFLNLFFSLLKLLPQKLRLPLFVSHWLPFNESLAF